MTQARPRGVLIVEDESIVAHDIQQTLLGLGYDAFAVAASAEEAIARASEKCPDLVLMDIRIKGELDGISTARLLQERFRVPIVYLTAHADEATIERAKQTGPHGYLLKPVKAAELRSSVEVALYKHEMDTRLRERERWFSTTLRSIADAVIAVDLGGRITFMNAAAESLTGCDARDAVGRPARDVVRLEDSAADKGETPLERALREGHCVELHDAELRSASDGQVRTIADSATLVVDENEALGAVMVFRDVTEQRKLQAQLELTHRLASLGTMAAGVAHEVNNPLGVITTGAEMVASELARQEEDLQAGHDVPAAERASRLEKAGRMVALVQSGASRIATIVAQLQSFARPRPAAAGQADVGRCVEWALWTTSEEFRHRARVVKALAAVPPARVDENRLGQVLVNLLLNAVQAIPPGDVEHNEVSIATRTDERGWVVVEVRDTGPGMPPEVLKRIFEPFFTTKPVGFGTGLGLAICHGIVASCGGDLHAESRPGEGSLFRVCLPPATAPEAAETPRPPEGGSWLPARILVVDDEDAYLEILRETLQGHQVVCAGSAREALRVLREAPPFDVILCDLMMPDLTGIDLYEELLRSRSSAVSRVIFMTGGATTPRGADFLRSVPNAVVEKPFSAATLQGAVQRLLAADRSRPAPE